MRISGGQKWGQWDFWWPEIKPKGFLLDMGQWHGLLVASNGSVRSLVAGTWVCGVQWLDMVGLVGFPG